MNQAPMPTNTQCDNTEEKLREAMTKSVADYIRLLHKQGYTAADQCLHFKDEGAVWTVQLYRIPDDAIDLIEKRILNQAGPEGQAIS